MPDFYLPVKQSRERIFSMMASDASYEISCDSEADAIEASESISAPHAPPVVPKVFMTNRCIFNCSYCGCRCKNNDRPDYFCSPRETASFAVEAAKDNGHGVFVTSAIYKNADYTQELIAETVKIIRDDYQYKGYVHAKVMPGADPLLIKQTGRYANRLSVNIEVAQSVGYNKIAKQKNKENILTPMKDISDLVIEAKDDYRIIASSQTTQLMAGSTGEDDRTIIKLSDALYRKYNLKRVYYTAYNYSFDACGYENLPHVITPQWRKARLYQADRLLQLYGFTPDEILPENYSLLEQDLDPKAAYALRHIDFYPVELNSADFDTLIRVPGIGLTYAQKIMEARKHSVITHDLLRKMKIYTKRSKYFITCNGKYIGGNSLDSLYLRDLIATEVTC